jgi:hypothetical protein
LTENRDERCGDFLWRLDLSVGVKCSNPACAKIGPAASVRMLSVR